MNYTHVLYHAGCNDGFGAAWAAWQKLGDKAQYIATHHGEPFPQLYADSEVIMLDMAYPRARHEELRKFVKSLVVVDHHKTAVEDIGDLPDVHVELNNSGAVLAWEHFHPGVEIPVFLRYIEDRDLWRYKLENSREVHSALSSYKMDFELWTWLSTRGTKALAEEGTPILRYRDQASDFLARQAFRMKIAGHEVPVVNCTSMNSEVGEKMNLLNPDDAFVASYFEKRDIRCWSLRSQGKIDVSEIAKKYGGGGHPNAAGFTESIHKKREDK